MRRNISYVVLPLLLGVVATLILNCFAGISGYGLENLAMEHPLATLAVFVLGGAFGWCALGATDFCRVKVWDSREKKRLRRVVSQQDDELIDLRARVSWFEAERRFRGSGNELSEQVVALHCRETAWRKEAK